MFFPSLLLVTSYFLASGTILFLGRLFNAFPEIRGLRRISVSIVFGPIALAWIYAWFLRVSPGQEPVFYFSMVSLVFLPGALAEGAGVVRSMSKLRMPASTRDVKSGNIVLFLAVLFLICTLFVIGNAAIKTPMAANDPMEYFFVARQIFDLQQLIGVYPLIDETIARGFYGPWTHPPGFVMLIVWGFMAQGTAEIASVAKFTGVYSLFSLLLLVYAWAGGSIRYRGVVAALLVLTCPMLLGETFDTHVDVPRIAMWTAVLCLVSIWFRRRSLSNTIALGALIGLSMFVHSIGLLFFPIFAGLLILVRGMSTADRAIQGILLALVAVLMVLPDYLQNLKHFGRIIGDSTPLWEIAEFKLDEFVNSDRQILTTKHKLVRGILDQLLYTSWYGYAGLTAAFAGCGYLLSVLISSRLQPQRILRHLRAPRPLTVLVLSCVGFICAIVLSIIADMNLIVKNLRYLATMIAVYAIVTVIAADVLLRYSGLTSFQNWLRAWLAIKTRFENLGRRPWLRGQLSRLFAGLAFLFAGAVLALATAGDVRRELGSRYWLFPFLAASTEIVDDQQILLCSRSGSFYTIGTINKAMLDGNADAGIKVLAFRPSDIVYYARFPFISYLDPKLIPAYAAKSSQEARSKLAELGVSHLLVPDYPMGEIQNTAMAKLLADPETVQLVADNKGYRLFHVNGQPAINWPTTSILNFDDGKSLDIDLSMPGRFVRGEGDNSLIDCSGKTERRVDEGANVLSISDQTIMELSQSIEIDLTKAYRLSFDLRVLPLGYKLPFTASIGRSLSGLATYDAEGTLQTTPPGAHRYGVAVNADLPADGTWVTFSGVFEGVGNETHNQFRAGTKYVAPIFILNAQDGPATRTEIRNLRFEELASGETNL